MVEQFIKKVETLYGLSYLCSICGEVNEPSYVSSAICDELADDWQLSDEQRRYFDYREGCSCKNCGSTVRVMNLGRTLLESINLKYFTNYQFVKDIDFSGKLTNCKIAEINNCGMLHSYLKRHPDLYYSEYGSKDPVVPSEDLMSLSYDDGFFDIVLTSDVIEHVPDYKKSLIEVRRVLSENGVYIFTVPFLPDRKTLVRSEINEGGVSYLKSQSFHGVYSESLADYLVFYEFGYDFVEELQKIFDVSLYCHEGYGGLISSVFSCRKVT